MELFESSLDNPIEQVTIQLSAAFNARDAVALASLYTDTATLMPPNEPMVKGNSAILVWFEQALKRLGGIRLVPMESGIFGEHAFQAGTFNVSAQLTTSSSAPNNAEFEQTGKYLLVLKSAGGQWKIHYDIWNVDQASS
jgi:ketosteroid isomerase-like protein